VSTPALDHTKPAGPDQWLSGTLFYSHPPVWACRVTPRGVEIVVAAWKPASATLAGTLFCIGFGAMAGFVVREAGCIGGILLLGAVPLTIAFASTFYVIMREYRRGGYMVYSTSARTVTLHRHGRVYPRADVLCWRVVSGNWSGQDGERKRHNDANSELQLVVRTADGPVAYPVVGWCNVSMAEGVRQVAQETGIPLEVVDHAEGVERSESQPRMDW
jgi:hypothetical protein